MKGDILMISDHHRRAANGVVEIILPEIKQQKGIYFITVAGESGAGKSEIAESIAKRLKQDGIASYLFQQDDYFHYPPKSNAAMRRKKISHVGTTEVRLDLLDEEVMMIRSGKLKFVKPLVLFNEDVISEEVIDLSGIKVVIIDGTYTTLLNNIDCRIFIERDMNDTRADRLRRNREKQDNYLEKILAIEHQIISSHKNSADIIISKDFRVFKNEMP